MQCDKKTIQNARQTETRFTLARVRKIKIIKLQLTRTEFTTYRVKFSAISDLRSGIIKRRHNLAGAYMYISNGDSKRLNGKYVTLRQSGLLATFYEPSTPTLLRTMFSPIYP